MTVGMRQVGYKEKIDEGTRNTEKRVARISMRRRNVVEIQAEWKRRRRRRRLVHTAPLCRPCIHTYSRTVQAADINNSLLIFICSGEMRGQSNPNTSRLSTCLSLCVVTCSRSPSIYLCIQHIELTLLSDSLWLCTASV